MCCSVLQFADVVLQVTGGVVSKIDQYTLQHTLQHILRQFANVVLQVTRGVVSKIDQYALQHTLQHTLQQFANIFLQWLFSQNVTQVQLHGGKTPIVLYQEMKLQFELHVSIEPAAASLQRFNWSGPPPGT